MKNTLIVISVVLLAYACHSPKIMVKQVELQQAIQAVVHENNCRCDSTKTIYLADPKDGKRNVYFWQKVITTVIAPDSLLAKAVSIKAAIENVVPALRNYRYIYIEFVSPYQKDEETTYKSTGTAYFVKDKCSGFLPGLDAAELAHRTHKRPFFQKKLCKN